MFFYINPSRIRTRQYSCTLLHRSNQTIISLMYTHTGAALSYRISLDLGRINIISPRVLSPAIPQVLPSASPPASRPRDIRDALVDVYIQAWTCNESATRARTARFAGATGMRGTRRVFSRSDSRALTLFFFFFFLFSPRARDQTVVEKKNYQRKDRGRIEDFFSFFFSVEEDEDERREGSAKRSWHYERSFRRKNDPLGGVILIMRVDRRLCGSALFSFLLARADKRVSIV